MVKTFCIIENGKVVNRAVSEKPLADNWVEADACIGDRIENGVVIRAEKAPEPEPTPEKIDLLVALLKEKNLINDEDATMITRTDK